jgi:hypothetical protein
MTGPSEPAMLLTFALSVGQAVEVDGAALVVTTATGPAPVQGPWLDEAEAKGLVEVTEAGAVVTARGRYWLDRFVTRKARAAGHRGKFAFAGGRVSLRG